MIYDHVIIGAGLSGLLKAESLMTLISSDQRVVLLDPNPEAVCDRTFCTWRKKTDLNHLHSALVSHRYDKFRITSRFDATSVSKSFDEFEYERIPGDAFHKFMHQKIFNDPRFEILVESVTCVDETIDHVNIETESGQKIQAFKVWNSLTQGKPDMIQHFFGFEIETESDFFDESVADLMDFRIDQKNEVRFVYQLPFSKKIGLVEFTIFSNSILSYEEYEKELRNYLQRIFNLTDFKVRSIEMGVIPMTLDPWPKFSSRSGFHRISAIGAAAGKIKASTGYSFLRNQLEQKQSFKTSAFQWRFQVYDTLLLGIMTSNGSKVSGIFSELFSKNSSNAIFNFLDEKTKFTDEIRIFLKLPWKNFLIQLLQNYPFMFVSAVLIPTNFVIHLTEASELAQFSTWSIPILGLLTLGISHGAIDHKLNPEISKLKFYAFYLFGLVGFFAFWMLSPTLSMTAFVLISADHFGESQFLRALKISGNQFKIRLLSVAWGLSVALMAPLFHWESAKPILQTLLRDSELVHSFTSSRATYFGIFFATVAIASSKIISRYEQKALGRSLPGALSTFFLVFVFWMLPLVPGFLTFFCFWHSWDTILQQKKGLDWSGKKYIKTAIPFSFVSSLVLVVSVYYFNSLENIWSYLFLLLGMLTVSHSLVMKRFYKF